MSQSNVTHFERRSLSPTGFMAALRDCTARRAAAMQRAGFHARLAAMSDRELLDIGIAEDELHRVHALESFTPRAWTRRGVRLD